MDNILQQLYIDHIFSVPYHPQSNGNLEVFHKCLKSTLKKLCENDSDNWDQYLNQVLSSYHVTLNHTTDETPFLFIYGRDPNLPLHQLLEKNMQHFLSDPDSECLSLQMHHLALAIAKKTLDETRFRNAQKITDHPAPNL